MGTKGLLSYLIKYARHFDSLHSYINYLKKILGKINISCSIDGLNMLNIAKRAGGNDFIIIVYNHLIKLLSYGISVSICLDGDVQYVEKQHELEQRNNKKKINRNKLKELEQIELANQMLMSNDNKENVETKELKNDVIYKSYDTSNPHFIEINKLRKKLTKINDNDTSLLHGLCKILNIPVYVALGDADALLSRLSYDKQCDFVISGDMDMLTFGCDRMVKIERNGIYEFEKNMIIKDLGFTSFEQFIDMCVLSGCDYVKYTPNIKLEDSRKYILQYGTIQNILNVTDLKLSHFLQYLDDYEKAKLVFIKKPEEEKVDYSLCILTEVDPQLLIKFFEKNTSGLSNKEKSNIIGHVRSVNFSIKLNIINKIKEASEKNHDETSTFTLKKIGDKLNFITVQKHDTTVKMSCYSYDLTI